MSLSDGPTGTEGKQGGEPWASGSGFVRVEGHFHIQCDALLAKESIRCQAGRNVRAEPIGDASEVCQGGDRGHHSGMIGGGSTRQGGGSWT